MSGSACCRALVGNGDAHDLGALVREAGDLLDGRLGVGGVGVSHRLDDDGSVAADLDVTDVDGAGLAAGREREGFVGHSGFIVRRE